MSSIYSISRFGHVPWFFSRFDHMGSCCPQINRSPIILHVCPCPAAFAPESVLVHFNRDEGKIPCTSINSTIIQQRSMVRFITNESFMSTTHPCVNCVAPRIFASCPLHCSLVVHWSIFLVQLRNECTCSLHLWPSSLHFTG